MSSTSPTADETEKVRLAVYQTFARSLSPTLSSLVACTRLPEPTVRSSLISLHESRDLVLAAGALAAFHIAATVAEPPASDLDTEVLEHTDPIVLAHPFATRNLGFSVLGTSGLWYGGCAWDAFAIPHLLPNEGSCLVSTRCPGCHSAIAVDVGSEHPPGRGEVATPRTRGGGDGNGGRGEVVAHFATPMKDAWTDVVETCSHQRLFCGEECVRSWCEREGRKEGYIMDLETLWKLAKGWYAGRSSYGYKRREPDQAREYFRSVGLKGSFWGLDD